MRHFLLTVSCDSKLGPMSTTAGFGARIGTQCNRLYPVERRASGIKAKRGHEAAGGRKKTNKMFPINLHARNAIKERGQGHFNCFRNVNMHRYIYNRLYRCFLMIFVEFFFFFSSVSFDRDIKNNNDEYNT